MTHAELILGGSASYGVTYALVMLSVMLLLVLALTVPVLLVSIEGEGARS